MKLENFLKKKLYYSENYKKKFFLDYQKYLTKLHSRRCPEYKKILLAKKVNISKITQLKDIPFLPSKIFKNNNLKSINNEKIFKILNSSGTSNNSLSKIILDKNTSKTQIKVLSKIVKSLIGHKRLPMIIIDTNSILTDRNQFSARVAGIHGFKNFSNDTLFALDEKMNLDFQKVYNFVSKHKGKKIIVFGFTYLIYQNFLNALKEKRKKINLSNSIMIHGGGWKKLQKLNISNEMFKSHLRKYCNLKNIYNYYGMVEQTGSIFFECNKGYFHTSIFNDVLIRDKFDLSLSKNTKVGIMQVFSLIPESYPGHSILTEDEGVIIGDNKCPCGMEGKYFKIIGRMQNSEIRGCSDTYE